jgi:hypothetical protein
MCEWDTLLTVPEGHFGQFAYTCVIWTSVYGAHLTFSFYDPWFSSFYSVILLLQWKDCDSGSELQSYKILSTLFWGFVLFPLLFHCFSQPLPPPPFIPTPRKIESSLFTDDTSLADDWQAHSLSQPGDISSNCSTIVYRSSPISTLGRQLIRLPNQVQVPHMFLFCEFLSCSCFVELYWTENPICTLYSTGTGSYKMSFYRGQKACKKIACF